MMFLTGRTEQIIKTPKGVETFEVGDNVIFKRMAIDYPTKDLIGTIVQFCYNSAFNGEPSYYACIKANCEYGSKLKYNNTVSLSALDKIFLTN